MAKSHLKPCAEVVEASRLRTSSYVSSALYVDSAAGGKASAAATCAPATSAADLSKYVSQKGAQYIARSARVRRMQCSTNYGEREARAQLTARTDDRAVRAPQDGTCRRQLRMNCVLGAPRLAARPCACHLLSSRVAKSEE